MGYGMAYTVDLSKKTISKFEIKGEIISRYIGGRGLASRLLFEMVDADVNPLSERNVLIFSNGPLTGTSWPSASRIVISAKSPLSGGLGYSNVGGYFGAALRKAGVDILIITGRSDKPVYLYIQDENAEIRDASHIWGLGTYDAMKELRKELGKISAAVIGPAGENKVLFSAIIIDEGRAAARTGMGAVMGSKMLKAVVAAGTQSIETSESFIELSMRLFRKCVESGRAEMLSRYGTMSLIPGKQILGDLPSYNHRKGTFPTVDKLLPEVFHEKFKIKRRSCFLCPIGCGRIVKYENTFFEGLEYETIAALGPNCGVGEPADIVKLNFLCNVLGLDTISTGVTIAWAMECYEKGIITEEDTGGLKLKWGDTCVMEEIIEQIAYRREFGGKLSLGVVKAAEKFGPDSLAYAMAVKGVEIPMQQPRAVKMFGLGHATSNRGADHLYALPTICYPWLSKEAMRYLGLDETTLDEFCDVTNPKLKAKAVVFSENLSAVVDSLGVCKFPTVETYIITPEELAEGYSYIVGFKIDIKDLLRVGERIVNLERIFNMRMGFTGKMDTLPERFMSQPLPDGKAKGSIVELDQMLSEYYKERGWYKGIPCKNKIKELELPNYSHRLNFS